MNKGLRFIVKLWIVVLVLCLAVFASEDQIAENQYQKAVSKHYKVPVEKVAETVEQGIAVEDLPIVYFIAQKSEVEPQAIIEPRSKGRSWAQIAAAHGMTAADFYVHVKGKNHGARFTKIFKKFSGLTRDEFNSVELSNDEITALANLRFLYKYHNYSQHLIMTWSGEGKTFVEINGMVKAAMEPAPEAKPAKDTSEVDSAQ